MTLQQLFSTDHITPQTAKVLQERLDKITVEQPLFFNAVQFQTLKAVCNRLIPQNDPQKVVDLAGLLDDQLYKDEGNGWRYDALPPDQEASVAGMAAIEQTAVSQFGSSFHLLHEEQQDLILSDIQRGTTIPGVWQLPPSRYFEELIGSLAELYYSHPYTKTEISDFSMSDALGWKNISLNNQEQL